MALKHGIEVIEDGRPSKVKKACNQDLRVMCKEQDLRKEQDAEQSTRNTLQAAVKKETA